MGLAFEAVASAFAEQTFQSLVLFQILFREHVVGADGVGVSVQLGPIVDFLALFLT